MPKSNVIGEIGKGYKIAIETLNEGRIGIGAQMLGLAQGALDHALAYAKQRKQFGKTIAEFQGVQFDLAEMAVEVEATRLMVYNAARLRDAGLPFVTEAAMCKYFASQVAERTASRAVEVLGGVGFTKDYPVEKLYRDSKIGRIYEGTSNMQRVTIAKQLLDKKCKELFMRILGTLLLAAGADCLPPIIRPSKAQIDEIIQKFAAHEAEFAKARENYVYRQTVAHPGTGRLRQHDGQLGNACRTLFSHPTENGRSMSCGRLCPIAAPS